MRYDVLTAGSYFCDVIFTGLPAFPALGTEIYTEGLTVVPGGILNTVVALQRLDVKIGWMGVLGNDFFSRFISEWIDREGIDTTLIERREAPFRRVTVALSYPQDRAFISHVDEPPDMIARLINEIDQHDIRCLHFTRLYVDERLPELLHACRARGIFVSMDCQHRQETLDMPFVRAVLQELDLFMPNASEAQRITGATMLNDAARILNDVVPYLVVKDGVQGAQAWRQGTHVHAPALHIMEVADTTGAGDVFNAGFLAAHLAGQDITTCLKWGNIAGGLSTLGYGGCSTAPTRTALLAKLAEWQ